MNPMPIKWKNIRIPATLHARLQALAKQFDRAGEAAKIHLPGEFADRGGTPMWYVVEKAIKDFEDHRFRSNQSFRPRSIKNNPG